MTARTTRLDWLLFVLLGFFWGSSYLFIKVGVDAGLAPLTLVALRLLIGFALLAVVFVLSRERLPRDRRAYGHIAVISVLSVALPFTLISWAEQDVDSTLAAVINGAIPLCVVVIAALALSDEPFTRRKVAGLLVGFVGVAIVVGFDPGVLAGTNLAPVLALVGSTLSYALGGVYSRRFLGGIKPITVATVEIGFALVAAATAATIVDGPIAVPGRLDALVAVGWLGIFGSGLAFLIFFRLLGRWGATRTSLVAYLMPAFGLALGVIVLGEPLDARLVAGMALVIAGIAVVNLRRDRGGDPAPVGATVPGRSAHALPAPEDQPAMAPASRSTAARAATASSMRSAGSRP